MCTRNRDDRKLENTVKQKPIQNTWESFTRSELKLESVHQESPRSDIFRKRATKPLLKQRHHQKHLTWAKEKRTGLLLSAPKSSFQMKINLAFNLEIRVPESGGREERHRIHVAWSPVWSFHSQWWFGLPCHLLVLVHCVFWSPQSTQPSTSTSCFLLLTSFMEMLISFSSRAWHLPTRPKVPKGTSSGGHFCSQHANCTLPQNLRHLWHCAVW